MYVEYTSCRFHTPGAVTHNTKLYETLLEEFFRLDEYAAELYEAILKNAIQEGLPVNDNSEIDDCQSGNRTHRAPVGKRAFRARRVDPIPWLGEIRVDGSDAVDGIGPFWRGYFTDLRDPKAPDTQIDDVLLASIMHKGGKDGIKKKEQNRHITTAGDAIRRWCRDKKRFTFRLQS